jgi:hypothetical protein
MLSSTNYLLHDLFATAHVFGVQAKLAADAAKRAAQLEERKASKAAAAAAKATAQAATVEEQAKVREKVQVRAACCFRTGAEGHKDVHQSD